MRGDTIEITREEKRTERQDVRFGFVGPEPVLETCTWKIGNKQRKRGQVRGDSPRKKKEGGGKKKGKTMYLLLVARNLPSTLGNHDLDGLLGTGNRRSELVGLNKQQHPRVTI